MIAAPLLVEIGCEEIPARMIRAAAAELSRRLVELLDRAGLAHGDAQAWGGSRRLAVRVTGVQPRQEDREELMLGPPAKVAFGKDGKPTPAALGFAKKQGVDASRLEPQETDKGTYVGFRRQVEGKTVGAVLAATLPVAVAGMPFPKTMRWADGRARWVRPVHWLLALHGDSVLPVELFGIRAGRESAGHRFLSDGRVEVSDPAAYEDTLERAGKVLVDPDRRRVWLAGALDEAAGKSGGALVPDPGLLEEVVDLVEWPGVVAGSFDDRFLELPRELLVTTLRHHQKCFSVQDDAGRLLARFLAVANTDRDPGGHIRRGNEWVVIGRLEDARFFWNEDLKHPLESRGTKLDGMAFHAKLGSYGDKAKRMAALAERIAGHLDLAPAETAAARDAALLSKHDLVSETVGEFPELQGRVGGLLLEAAGEAAPTAEAVYSHYQPSGPDDAIPPTVEGCVVSLADKLDSTAALIGAGETPTGSRDPFGLRRATSGIFRIVIERGWALSLSSLAELGGGHDRLLPYLADRLQNFLRERGYTANEIPAVLQPRISPTASLSWPLPEISARLDSIRTVRARSDFAHLVDLTKRVDNIISKGVGTMLEDSDDIIPTFPKYEDPEGAARALWDLVERSESRINKYAGAKNYDRIVDELATYVDPVERFFVDVLVLDPKEPRLSLNRREGLIHLRGILTRCFDIRELAGQAEERS